MENRSVGAPGPGTNHAVQSAAVDSAASRYRVQRGDTLYSIAFRHGIDYRELAGWNHIGAPYTIYVGQELRVAAADSNVHTETAARPRTPNRTTTTVVAASAPTAAPAPTRAPPHATTPAPAPFEDVTASSGSTPQASPDAPSPAASPVPAPKAAASTSAPTPAVPPAPTVPPASAPTAAGEITWRWPAEGQLVGTYLAGDQTRQGVDIAGKAGDPVRAAADGTVVYSGNGLIGYGELIIVKHSPTFLSAYGHNRRRLVKEGDHVSAGQVIAEMGSSSANRDSLHFEIRKSGKPANPLDYLPRR